MTLESWRRRCSPRTTSRRNQRSSTPQRASKSRKRSTCSFTTLPTAVFAEGPGSEPCRSRGLAAAVGAFRAAPVRIRGSARGRGTPRRHRRARRSPSPAGSPSGIRARSHRGDAAQSAPSQPASAGPRACRRCRSRSRWRSQTRSRWRRSRRTDPHQLERPGIQITQRGRKARRRSAGALTSPRRQLEFRPRQVDVLEPHAHGSGHLIQRVAAALELGPHRRVALVNPSGEPRHARALVCGLHGVNRPGALAGGEIALQNGVVVDAPLGFVGKDRDGDAANGAPQQWSRRGRTAPRRRAASPFPGCRGRCHSAWAGRDPVDPSRGLIVVPRQRTGQVGDRARRGRATGFRR